MTETESMVVRVAKAICAAEGESWRTGFYPIMSGPNFEFENHDADKLNNKWRFVARAAIEAMRDCDNDMLEAMHTAMFEDKFTGGELPMLNAGWLAMIDKALEKDMER